MEITKKNFKETLPCVKEAIDRASFMAIDTEFTGLCSMPEYMIHSLDTPEERYYKLREGSTNFLIVQFGLCTFELDKETNSYITRAFNFYTFPRQFSRQAPDLKFMCQASSIDFLITQNFDFNKTFKEGISWLPQAQETKLREALEEKHSDARARKASTSPAFNSPNNFHVHKGPPQIPEEHKSFIEEVCVSVENFQKEEDKKQLTLSPCSAYRRKLLYQNIGLRFPSGIHLKTETSNEGKNRYIVITKVGGSEDIQAIEEEKRQQEIDELETAVGFAKVFRMISESNKLVLGHNMMLDLVLSLHHFWHPLPEDYEEFKMMTKCILPKIIDTKLMATSQPFRDILFSSVLGELHSSLSAKPFQMPSLSFPDGFPEYNKTTEKLHEAGYDAYITGCCFAAMANYLGYQKNSSPFTPSDSDLVEPFLNKVHLMRVYDIPYINLSGNDLQPNRDHVLYITFPSHWKSTDLTSLFSAFGNIQITWINDTSAYVSLCDKQHSKSALKTLSKSDACKILSYQNYQAMKNRDFPSSQATERSATKRKTPASDVDLPAKVRRPRSKSSEGSLGKRSIDTIPEEEEDEHQEQMEEEDEEAEEESDVPQPLTEAVEDIGEPVTKKLKHFDEKGGGDVLDRSAANGSATTGIFEQPDW